MTTSKPSRLTMLRFWVYRFRVVIMTATGVLVAIAVITAFFDLPSSFRDTLTAATSFALTITAVTFAVTAFSPPPADHIARVVHAPVTGRWMALNSPATQVPSHGVRMYGQSYAIDMVYWPQQQMNDSRQPAGLGMERSETFLSFGQPVLAMVTGTVIAASDWRRDHRSRTDWPSQIFFAFESLVRLIGGPSWVIGNHITIRTDDGTFALVSHLQQQSSLVSRGGRVTTGQHIASCGNSGNSSEPHVHAQLMDRASPWIAQGIPMRFSPARVAPSLDAGQRVMLTSELTLGVMPATGEVLIAAEKPRQS